MKTALATILIVALLAAAGCHKRAKVVDEMQQDGVASDIPEYQVVWIDPIVIETNAKMTLIRSDRTDTIKSATGELLTHSAPAISFDIANQPCLATVRMLDARGKTLEQLLTKTLGPGHYKLTVHKPPPAANPNIPYNYAIEAAFCGETKVERITSAWTGGH